MRKQITILLAWALLVTGCKKVTVDFSYSPAEPRAGETVIFVNNSSAGETWDWNFGDNTTSISKHPRHIYKKAGEYLITLRVDSANNQTISKSITVYDTIPTFISSTDSITHYTDVTLTANIYNPFAYTLSYAWTLPEHCVLQSGSLTGSSVTVYFSEYNQPQTVRLTITQGDKQFSIARELYIYETQAPAILMARTDGTVMRQRLIEGRLEHAVADTDEGDKSLLAAACDTMLVYGDSTFFASKMQPVLGTPVKRMQFDAQSRKWYYLTGAGLFVANINGENQQLIDAEASGALYVDNSRNRLYWATAKGMYAMPLVKSLYNQFSSTPEQYNEINDIERITVDNEPR